MNKCLDSILQACFVFFLCVFFSGCMANPNNYVSKSGDSFKVKSVDIICENASESDFAKKIDICRPFKLWAREKFCYEDSKANYHLSVCITLFANKTQKQYESFGKQYYGRVSGNMSSYNMKAKVSVSLFDNKSNEIFNFVINEKVEFDIGDITDQEEREEFDSMIRVLLRKVDKLCDKEIKNLINEYNKQVNTATAGAVIAVGALAIAAASMDSQPKKPHQRR
ncbi:hypothetical protein [Candidatus Gromoviella agglomerans]|uniref:hypothetical protein n=1 Tax=Candidatus Gromoviella agglomerans TaxID=2806609 RepID=UPI001E38F879|nr:hypothetical protein [Candidatus Gromoviella agglomerans]UFX98587.1 hypothetical protein Gromo_00504 [Candidatus Gromoviella agglomerans]